MPSTQAHTLPQRIGRTLWRWLLWSLLALLALQVFFLLRIALMAVWAPQSTTFMRSEAYRGALVHGRQAPWAHRWVDYADISPQLKRAVIASEDSGFMTHSGVEWKAIETARQRNLSRQSTGRSTKLVGGSTITQQLAKNLLLSGERHLLRKGQELVLTLMLEGLLDKRRILEIYLNSVEWGDGVFGAEAAAQHYFNKPAARLSQREAARLAVMLPAPKLFQSRPNSAYLNRRAATIAARMRSVTIP